MSNDTNKPDARTRYRATYIVTKTMTVDAYDPEEARREIDHFICGIRGDVEVVSIEPVEV